MVPATVITSTTSCTISDENRKHQAELLGLVGLEDHTASFGPLAR
jgi:hypothetical protein